MKEVTIVTEIKMSNGRLSRKKLRDTKNHDQYQASKPRFLRSSKNPKDHNFEAPISVDKMSKKFRQYKSHLHSVDWTEKISHEKMSWVNEGRNDPVDEELPNVSEDSFSSSSNTSTLDSSSSMEFSSWKTFEPEDEKRARIMKSKWGGYGLHLRLWEDTNAPVTKVRKCSDLILDNLETRGILSDRMIGACSSFLTLSPENKRHILSKCDLNKMKLTDITILRYHRYLQYLDLSHNFLKDLQALSGIPYLIFLNVSHNKLQDLLNFTPPWYLTYVNLSHNDITVMTDLSEFWSIVRLDLSHNAIETISGLQNLRYLRYLNISYNLIETVSNLDDLLSIQELNLEYNYITTFKSANPESGINTLANLRTVIMGHNRLSTLEFFRGVYGLRLIDLRNNKISDLLEVSNLKSLVYEVDLRGNPCTKWPNYKDVLLFSMPSVKFVDGAEVAVSEKVSAATLFDPPVELLAAMSISKLVLLEQLGTPKIDASVTPYDLSSPPLIILSGPSAVRKVALGIQVAEKLTDRVRYCRSYTTREVPEEEDESKAYYFIKRDEFNDMARRGEFLSSQELLGHGYGFHTNEIAAMRMENKIGVTQMDLNATIQMMNRYPNVKPILVMTKCEEFHRDLIKQKFQIFTWIKDSVENLLAVKIGQNINTESLETSDSGTEFITDLVNAVVNNLHLPTYSTCVKPQGNGSTATDLIQHSNIYLPKAIKSRSRLEIEEKKHITFFMGNNTKSDILQEIDEDSETKSSDLRVILDEYSNILVDDEESKRKRKKARALFRRSVLKLRSAGIYDGENELNESVSSGHSLQTFPARQAVEPEYLKNMYIELVLKSRKLYVEQHRTKPGFYSLVIFTDDFENAINRLIEFLYEIFINQSLRKPILLPELEYLDRFVIPEKVCAIVKELRENLSTAKVQKKTLLRTHGMTSWKDSMPSQTSPNTKDLVNSIEEEFKKRSKAESLNLKK